MNFSFTEEQEAWRSELREFLSREHPLPTWQEFSDEGWRHKLEFQARVADRGWIGLSWPIEYGGLGRPLIDQLIYAEEMGLAHAPDPGGIGARFVAPTVMHWGRDDQKAHHLPLIRQGRTLWCQGFSEPASGSDLASLQTRATRTTNGYVINGQKVWTSFAERAQWCLLAARTNPEAPKHKGLSLFIVPMATPGIEIRPILDLMGRRAFNLLSFEDVTIALDALLGEEDKGWLVATTTLDFERSNALAIGRTRRDISNLCQAARESGVKAMWRLADVYIGGEIARLLSRNVISVQLAGRVPNRESSAAKLFWSELAQTAATISLSVGSLQGLALESGRSVASAYLASLAHTIAGGTSEVQRNIIAQRGLGMPR
jgi:alkylation response protein AidB-like acyl-CoA dehydrogenase